MSTFSVEQYIAELLKDAQNLPKEEVEAVKKVLANPAVAARVKDTALMRSDYSRNMDRLREQEGELQRKVSETENFYQAQIMADHNNQEAYSKLQGEVTRLRAALGNPDPQNPLPSGNDNNNGKYLTVEEWNKREAQLQSQSLSLMAKTNFLAMNHFKEFGEVLNVEEWQKHAMKLGLPLDVAYKSFTEEIRTKRDEVKRQKELEEAKQQGAMEYASKHNLPLVDSHPRGVHALKPEGEVPRTSVDRVRAATEAYMRREA